MKQEVYESLEAISGRENVLRGRSAVRGYSRDALGRSRGFSALPRLSSRPWLVVRPRSTEEVAEIVKLACREKIAIVPYGGGSGLMGGALSLQGGMVIDLKGMDRILSISHQDRTVVAEAGVMLNKLDEELNRNGLILGHDPYSLSFATLGGAISTDGLGYRGARYGSMGDQVLGLEVVLPDGNVLQTRAVPKSSTGVSLNRLFIGAEGTLGIITKATLRAFPMPERRSTYAFGFDSFERGFEAIVGMFGIGLKPALLDFGEGSISPLDRLRRRITSPATPATLYMVFEGFAEEVEAAEKRAAQICRQYGAVDLGARRGQSFWEGRHRPAERYYRSPLPSLQSALLRWGRGLKFDFIHVSLPTSRVVEYRSRCKEILARHHVHLMEYGIWTQPELFSAVMVDLALTERRAQANMEAAVNELLMLAQDFAGSMEYCHGVGVRLAHLMERELGPGLEVMRRIKQALDPDNIMNPGKLAL